jgi:hypothetical protein
MKNAMNILDDVKDRLDTIGTSKSAAKDYVVTKFFDKSLYDQMKKNTDNGIAKLMDEVMIKHIIDSDEHD